MKESDMTIEYILRSMLAYMDMSAHRWNEVRPTRLAEGVVIKQLVSLLASEQGFHPKEIAEVLGVGRTTVIKHRSQMQDYCTNNRKYKNLVNGARLYLSGDVCPQFIFTERAYLSRTKGGLLLISPQLPEKYGDFWMAEGTKPFSQQDQFPQITYETGPVEVSVTVKIEEDEKM